MASFYFVEQYKYNLLEIALHLSIRGPPHSDLISIIQIGGKKGGF